MLSASEIDPGLGDNRALVAYARNGEFMDQAHGLRLVLPNDHHAARNISDVVKVEVR
jgi:hypothetical protein